MDQYTRRIIGFGVHAGIVDGIALCKMFLRTIRGQGLPKYLISDHDPLYRHHQWQANLAVLDALEIKTVPYVPRSHAGGVPLLPADPDTQANLSFYQWRRHCGGLYHTPMAA
jgi:hypothetical protein